MTPEVESREFRVVQLGDEHGGHAVERGAALGLHRLEGRERVEALAGVDHGAAMGQRREVADDHAEAVVERHRDADTVRLGQPQSAADEVAVVEDIVMRQRHALGRAGGAAGKLDVHRVVELELACEFAQLSTLGLAAPGRHLVEGDRPWRRRSTDLDHGAQLRQPRRGELARHRGGKLRREGIDHPDVVAGLERGRRHQGCAAGLVEGELQLGKTIGRVDRHQDQPGPCGGELRQRPFGAVERPDADPITAPETECEKPGREGIRVVPQLAPGPPDVLGARDQGGAVRPYRGGAVQRLPDGPAE
jgi:hypothetical protein